LKTLKISDEAHAKLTSVVGRLMVETGKMKTYSDAIEAVLWKSVLLPTELLSEVESFMKNNPQLGYHTKEEFIQDAIRFRFASLPETRKMDTENKKMGIVDCVTRGHRANL
jgi:hypothetical protein